MESCVSCASDIIVHVSFESGCPIYLITSTPREQLCFSDAALKLANSHKVHPNSNSLNVTIINDNANPFGNVLDQLSHDTVSTIMTNVSTLALYFGQITLLSRFPVVIHAAIDLDPSFGYFDIMSLRQSGFTLIQSSSLLEVLDLSVSSFALASRCGKGVIHFFNSNCLPTSPPTLSQIKDLFFNLVTNFEFESIMELTIAKPTTLLSQFNLTDGERDTIDGRCVKSVPSHKTSQTAVQQLDGSLPCKVSVSVVDSITAIWKRLLAVTGRCYDFFRYEGSKDVENVVYAFGLSADFMNDLRYNLMTWNIGLIVPVVLRPFVKIRFRSVLPKSAKCICIVERVHQKLSGWGYNYLDVVTSCYEESLLQPICIFGYQVGQINNSDWGPLQKDLLEKINSCASGSFYFDSSGNKEVGPPSKVSTPKIENVYIDILYQLFGTTLRIANHREAFLENTISILNEVSSSVEFLLGSMITYLNAEDNFSNDIKTLTNSLKNPVLKDFLVQWLNNADGLVKRDYDNVYGKLIEKAKELLLQENTELTKKILDKLNMFEKKSHWLIGSDAWAYDLGRSGVHHFLTSGRNVNMLIIDSTQYDGAPQGGVEVVKPRKKDIALYGMNFGNAYVASVAVYSSYTQVLQAMEEANRFIGPSIIVAYLPYNNDNDSPLEVLKDSKKAVDSGYWPLFRWNPMGEENGDKCFKLDSECIRGELSAFLQRDNYLSIMMKRIPEISSGIDEHYGKYMEEHQKKTAMLEQKKIQNESSGLPVKVLYASDTGNAQGLAEKLSKRGAQKGLKTELIVMEDFAGEDLGNEKNVLFLTSTAGQGEFPGNGRSLWEYIKNNTLDLSGLNFGVFGLGDSHYWPRAEDKFYYNKPCKDLFLRLESYGAKAYCPVGLGDDQDPDGFMTGYSEWETKIWAALGVGGVGLDEPEESTETVEDIKQSSRYLRGTIKEGILDTTTGAISLSDQTLTKFHGTYMQDDRDLREQRKAMSLEPAYSFMIRCRLPGGVATPEQWLQMDEIADKFGNGTMKLTTRQTFQFHGVIKGKLKPAMQAINRALMTTLAACGDVNRNVMCSSLPEHSEYHREVYEVSKRISDHLLPSTTAYHEIWLMDEEEGKKLVAGNTVVDHEPLYGATYLPRKFKITIAIPPYNDTDVYAHDVGLIAIRGDNGKLEGFNVLAGGGMGVTHNNRKTYPQIGRMLGYVKADRAEIVCEKIMIVQRDNGDRKNRKHARLKYTIDDMGVQVFKSKVEELMGFGFEKARGFKFDRNIDTFGWVKDEKGLNHFTFFIENGRIEDRVEFEMKRGLRAVAQSTKGEFRLTGNQHLILSGVSDEELDEMKALLKRFKLDNTEFSGLRLSSSACVAFPTCGLAMAESERYLPGLITKMETVVEQYGLRHDSIVMRMTGCPNGCARPWLGEVGFVGKAYGIYNVYLGGGYYGQRLNKLYRSNVKECDIVGLLSPLIKSYALEREENEKFGDFVIRKGVVQATVEGRDFHENLSEEAF